MNVSKKLDEFIKEAGLELSSSPHAALFLAGMVFTQYRRVGRSRARGDDFAHGSTGGGDGRGRLFRPRCEKCLEVGDYSATAIVDQIEVDPPLANFLNSTQYELPHGCETLLRIRLVLAVAIELIDTPRDVTNLLLINGAARRCQNPPSPEVRRNPQGLCPSFPAACPSSTAASASLDTWPSFSSPP